VRPFLRNPVALAPSAWIALAVLLAFSGGMAGGAFDSKPRNIPPMRSLTLFPLNLGPWHGRFSGLSEFVLEVLQPTDYLLANFADDAGNNANLYVAYYSDQRNAAPHAPELCIPSDGWEVVQFETIELSNVPGWDRPPFQVKRALIKKGDTRQVVYFWLVERGRPVTSYFQARWLLFVDALKSGRTDGGLIRALTPIRPGEQEADADARLVKFLGAVLPKLAEHIPM